LPRSFILPGHPTRYGRDHSFLITHLKLEIEPDFDRNSISGKALFKVSAAGSPISNVEFDAVDMDFSSIRVDGKEASFVRESQSVEVNLGRDVTSEEFVHVELGYSVTPKRGLYFRGPTEKFPDRFTHLFTQGEPEDSKFWFPCYDYPNMRFTTEILVRAPARMTAISNGRLVAVKDEGDKKLWEFSQEIPFSSYLLSIVVGEYERVALAYQGISVEYYVPADRRKDVPRSFEKTPKMIDYFTNATGQKYPYPKYAQVVVSDFMVGGMENITATTLTETTLHDERGHLDFQSDNLVSHELAHQWFGDYLTCKDWSHAWLNEGFATYFNALFREHDEGPDDFQYAMQADFERHAEETSERYQRQIVEKRYWHPDELFDTHIYEKGAWVLNGLRGLLGDELFFLGVKRYVAANKSSLVETSDLRKVLEDVSGLNLERFFEEWLYCPGFPEYEVAYSFDEKNGMAKLDVEQVNSGMDGVPLFTTPIEILFTLKDGSKKSTKVVMAERKSTFFFSLQTQPVNVNFDPKNWILKKLKFCKPKEMFLHQLHNDQNTMERVRAAEALSEIKTDEVVEELSIAIDSDQFWGVKLEAAKYLGKVGSKRALDFLLSKKDHKDHRARRGVAVGLRYFAEMKEGREEALNALVDYVNNDYSYYVRAHAANSLGFFKNSEKAKNALTGAIAQESVNDQVRYRAFLGFAEMKDPMVIPLAKEYLENGKWSPGKLGAIEAAAKSGRGRPEVLELLLSLQTDPDVRVRDEAATSIQYLDDSSAILGLEEWLLKDDDGRVRRRIRETLFVLRQNIRESEKVASLEREVQKVGDEAKKLKEELDSLKSAQKS